MLIKVENRHLYPGGSPVSKEWKAIRKTILERAGHRCERCNAPDREYVDRPYDRETYMLAGSGAVFCATTGEPLGWILDDQYSGGHRVKIVLTIAHLDQDPRNNDPANLQALCQRCHNLHDAPHRRRNAGETRRGRKAVGDLFGAGE
jgi:5-methylcytosine-specific restriction endonuclease McrA